MVTNSQFSQLFILLWQFLVSTLPIPTSETFLVEKFSISWLLIEWTTCSPHSEWAQPFGGQGSSPGISCLHHFLPLYSAPSLSWSWGFPASGNVRENSTRQWIFTQMTYYLILSWRRISRRSSSPKCVLDTQVQVQTFTWKALSPR